MSDNNKINTNKFDSVFSEATPSHLKQSILQQAEIILAQNRRREVLKKFAFVFGGLAAASVVGISISQKFFKFNKTDLQMAEWANMLSHEDGLSIAELSDEDMEMFDQFDQLEQFESITDDEFNFILKEDV